MENNDDDDDDDDDDDCDVVAAPKEDKNKSVQINADMPCRALCFTFPHILFSKLLLL
jgi:hypothetical protein